MCGVVFITLDGCFQQHNLFPPNNTRRELLERCPIKWWHVISFSSHVVSNSKEDPWTSMNDHDDIWSAFWNEDMTTPARAYWREDQSSNQVSVALPLSSTPQKTTTTNPADGWPQKSEPYLGRVNDPPLYGPSPKGVSGNGWFEGILWEMQCT